jgi:glycosyltransferase involved in cell wall biosynthesis
MAVRRARRTGRSAPRVLIVVQNLSVPLDRRVWQECRSLIAAGFGVSVICPRAEGEPALEVLDGVDIRRYRPPRHRGGVVGYAREYIHCWLATAWHATRIFATHGFDALQACNPPDTYWALALLFKPFGVRFVYDQHDLCPEVFDARFGSRHRLVARGVLLLERATYRTADHVIATNDSYRSVAIARGRRPPATVTVVRSGPDPNEMKRGAARPELRNGADHLACYLGIMGPQDGVDLLVRAIAVLVHDRGRKDTHFALLGFGDCLTEVKALASELGVEPWVTFTGRADRAMVAAYLSTADVGVCPDPCSAFNDISTMNKVLEYMAHEIPVVAFDLRETRTSAGPAAVYVPGDDIERYADAIASLLDDPERRAAMGRIGRARIESELGWHRQAPLYIGVYRQLLGLGEDEALPNEDPDLDERRTLEGVA